GAGYKATIVNILEGQEDQWFRPSDVAMAPDGSLFVADWYDPGVGGHQVGDLERGRIYRVAPDTEYDVTAPPLETPEQAAQALLSTNSATRYLAFTALDRWGTDAEAALQSLWESDNNRHRAQALWLLSRMPVSGPGYIEKAIADPDPDIRITGLRAARALEADIIPIASVLAEDTSPQVRREVAISLNGNESLEAARLWTLLANQHDGKDRWYLEALGIGAAGHDDLFFEAWLKENRNNLNTQANRDIIWRSRSSLAAPLLTDVIASAGNDEMLRYFRAFDFHNGPAKQAALTRLALASSG